MSLLIGFWYAHRDRIDTRAYCVFIHIELYGFEWCCFFGSMALAVLLLLFIFLQWFFSEEFKHTALKLAIAQQQRETLKWIIRYNSIELQFKIHMYTHTDTDSEREREVVYTFSTILVHTLNHLMHCIHIGMRFAKCVRMRWQTSQPNFTSKLWSCHCHVILALWVFVCVCVL